MDIVCSSEFDGLDYAAYTQRLALAFINAARTLCLGEIRNWSEASVVLNSFQHGVELYFKAAIYRLSANEPTGTHDITCLAEHYHHLCEQCGLSLDGEDCLRIYTRFNVSTVQVAKSVGAARGLVANTTKADERIDQRFRYYSAAEKGTLQKPKGIYYFNRKLVLDEISKSIDDFERVFRLLPMQS